MVGEHETLLEDLMRRPVSSGAERGHACLSLLHGPKIEAVGVAVERDELDAENPLPYRRPIF